MAPRFGAPWAKDANGVAVPTHFEIQDGSVTQIINHTSGEYTYPITADPWFGIGLISRVSWSGATLSVFPTTWGRYWWLSGYAARWAAWGEVIGRAPGANRANMEDQFYCHWDFVRYRAPFKVSWNLDANRPHIGYAATVLRE